MPRPLQRVAPLQIGVAAASAVAVEASASEAGMCTCAVRAAEPPGALAGLVRLDVIVLDGLSKQVENLEPCGLWMPGAEPFEHVHVVQPGVVRREHAPRLLPASKPARPTAQHSREASKRELLPPHVLHCRLKNSEDT